MIGRLPGVLSVQDTGTVSSVNAYQSPLIPAIDTNALSVDAATLDLPAAAGTSLAQGEFLNAATAHLPVAVLGYEAAQLLGIDRIRPGMRIWVGGQWFYVTGILNPAVLAPEIDSEILVGFPAAQKYLSFDGHPSKIYIRTVNTTTRVDIARPSSSRPTPGPAAWPPPCSSAPPPGCCPPSAPPDCRPPRHSGASDTRRQRKPTDHAVQERPTHRRRQPPLYRLNVDTAANPDCILTFPACPGRQTLQSGRITRTLPQSARASYRRLCARFSRAFRVAGCLADPVTAQPAGAARPYFYASALLSRTYSFAAVGSAFCWSWAPPRHLGATVRWRTWRTSCRE
jgi:hypothetical protein